MKKFFIIIFCVFLLSCVQNNENNTSKNTTPENISQTIFNSTIYIFANILNPDNLQISELSFGSKGYHATQEELRNQSHHISYFFGAKGNNTQNIEFLTNTKNNATYKALISLWSEKNGQENVSKNITSTGDIINYNLSQLITPETLAKYQDSFEITHTEISGKEKSKNIMIIDMGNLQKFLTKDAIVSVTIPRGIDEITYTTTDGQIHNYPIEKMMQNTEYSETKSHCGVDAPGCVLIFNQEEAKNIAQITIEGLAPKQ